MTSIHPLEYLEKVIYPYSNKVELINGGTMEQQDIKFFFKELSNLIKKNAKKDYEQVKELINADTSSPEKYFNSFKRPLERTTGFLITKDFRHKPEAVFLYENYNFVKSSYDFLIKLHEGRACSADKSRIIINALTKFLKTGEEIKLNYNQEYTYHLPRRIFRNHKQIYEFFDSLQKLYYGQPLKYLETLHKILMTTKKEEEINE